MGKRWVVYTLNDPRDGRVRYVGCTARGTRRRQEHRMQSHPSRTPALATWIKELHKLGLQPEWSTVLYGVGVTDLQARQEERAVTDEHRAAGAALVNERRAHQSKEELAEYRRRYSRSWKEQNPERYREYLHNYYLEHRRPESRAAKKLV